jgi:hypothetical protein
MTDDALEAVLRLVADGRLSAEEAGQIIDALETKQPSSDRRADPDPVRGSAAPPAGGPGRALRVEVTEAGRKVVNLRVPLAFGQAALRRIPGLSDATSDRIREAIDSGLTGPIVAVDEHDGDGVRILIE